MIVVETGNDYCRKSRTQITEISCLWLDFHEYDVLFDCEHEKIL